MHDIIGLLVQDFDNKYENSNVVLDESTDLFPSSTNFSNDQNGMKVWYAMPELLSRI